LNPKSLNTHKKVVDTDGGDENEDKESEANKSETKPRKTRKRKQEEVESPPKKKSGPMDKFKTTGSKATVNNDGVITKKQKTTQQYMDEKGYLVEIEVDELVAAPIPQPSVVAPPASNKKVSPKKDSRRNNQDRDTTENKKSMINTDNSKADLTKDKYKVAQPNITNFLVKRVQ